LLTATLILRVDKIDLASGVIQGGKRSLIYWVSPPPFCSYLESNLREARRHDTPKLCMGSYMSYMYKFDVCEYIYTYECMCIYVYVCANVMQQYVLF